MHEPYPPVVPLPQGLSDEAAAQLLDYLYEFTRLFENYYAGQLHRYYAPPTAYRQTTNTSTSSATHPSDRQT